MSNGLTRGLVAEPAVIDDGLTQTTSTWSSTKIAAEIAGGGGGGGVTGPGTSTLNAVARWANTSGTTLANSGVLAAASTGSAAAPALSFSTAQTTGVYLASVGLGPSPAVGLAAEGTSVLVAASDRILANRNIFGQDGSAAAPGYAFQSNSQAGMYYDGAGGTGLAQGGLPGLIVSPAAGGRQYTVPIVSLSDTAVGLPKGAEAGDVITTTVTGAPALLSTASASSGFGFDGIGGPLIWGTSPGLALAVGPTTASMTGGTFLATGAGNGMEVGSAGVGMYDGAGDFGSGSLSFRVLDDTSTPTLAMASQYNVLIARAGLYSGYYATDGNVQANTNLNDDLSDTNGGLALSFAPYAGNGANGFDVPTTVTPSTASIGTIIDGSRVHRTVKAGLEIQSGKWISLDGGANTLTGIMKGRTTFTPVVGDGTTTMLLSGAGWYQVEGRVVTWGAQFTISNKNGLTTQAVRINMPFGTVYAQQYMSLNSPSFINLSGSSLIGFNVLAQVSTTYGRMIYQTFSAGTASEVDLVANNLTTSQPVYCGGSYFIV